MKQEYVGICPSSAGFFQAKQIKVSAESVEQALELIRQEIVGYGSRYVSRIVRLADRVTVWEESQLTKRTPHVW